MDNKFSPNTHVYPRYENSQCFKKDVNYFLNYLSVVRALLLIYVQFIACFFLMAHFKDMLGILMPIMFGVLFTVEALCNIDLDIATLHTFNIVIYMPGPLCSC